MKNRYFVLDDDVYLEGRWHLGDLFDQAGTELDARDFRYGRPMLDASQRMRVHLWNSEATVEVEPPLRVSLHTRGIPLDFTFTTADMPVVTSKVADILDAVVPADIQRIPVVVESREYERYEIINVISRARCIDPIASELDWWTEADGRPDLLGKAKTIKTLIVDPDRIHGVGMFRLEERGIQIIVSDAVRSALDQARVSGVRFLKA